MNEYRLLLESIGIYDHNIPIDPIITPPTKTYSELEWAPNLFELDYFQEVDHKMNMKKFHRYSRKTRFKSILYQLLGISGECPREVLRLVRRSLPSTVKPTKIWNNVRAILKQNKLRKYYNRIPQIIRQITTKKLGGLTYHKVESILHDFFVFDYQFNQTLKLAWKRKYFPNLRFIALKLMFKYNIKYPYYVPLIRTARKRKYLDNLFTQFKNV